MSVIFLQKAMIQDTIFKIVMLYLLKVYPSYWTLAKKQCTIFSCPSIQRIWPDHRIEPDQARNWPFSSFLKLFFIIMFVKYVYDHDVWIIRLGF